MATHITCDGCYERLPIHSTPAFAILDVELDNVLVYIHLCKNCRTSKERLYADVTNPHYVATPAEPTKES